MKMKTIIVLAFAVGCGLIAMMGVQQMIAKQDNNQDVPVKVLVATANIPPGVLLSESNCVFQEFPSSAVPADAVRSKEDYFERGLKVPVDKGDIIRMVKLGTKGEIAASASIPVGMRTFSFKVDDTKTHSGLLQPGDRVDLSITFEYVSINNTRVTRTDTLLEYVEIFAADEFRNLEAGESREIKAKNLTLLVTPDEANLLQLAIRKGELTPHMRNKDDKVQANAKGVDDDLMALLTTGVAKRKPEEDEEEGKPVTDSSAAAALKNLLNGGMKKPDVTLKEEVVVQTATWTVDVYAGEEIISHEFEVEAEDSQDENSAVKFPEPAKKSSLTRIFTRPLNGMMKPFLKSKKQEQKQKSEESFDGVFDEDKLEEEEMIEGEYQTEDDFKTDEEVQQSKQTQLLVN